MIFPRLRILVVMELALQTYPVWTLEVVGSIPTAVKSQGFAGVHPLAPSATVLSPSPQTLAMLALRLLQRRKWQAAGPGRTWSVLLKLRRPALSRTTERGMSTRAAATQRTMSSGPGGAAPSSGVPATATCAAMQLVTRVPAEALATRLRKMLGWRGVCAAHNLQQHAHQCHLPLQHARYGEQMMQQSSI